MDEFWPDVADSAWICGEAEGWERGPDTRYLPAKKDTDEHFFEKKEKWISNFKGSSP